MANTIDENEKRKLAAEAAQQGSPDDVIAGPDAPVVGGDPQIMTMTGAQPTAAPGNDMFRRTMQGQQGEQGQHGEQHGQHGHMGWGGMGQHHGWLQQIMQRIQEARAQREQHQGQGGMQQFGQTPWGQQFMASPFGQQMQQQHPGWFPQAAPAGQTPANIVEGDHTGMPAPAAAAMPPTAAQAAQAQATAPQAAAAPAAPAAPAQTARAPMRDQAQQPPMGVMQRAPQQGTRQPMFGGGASAAIQDEIKRRQGGMGGGGNRRMF